MGSSKHSNDKEKERGKKSKDKSSKNKRSGRSRSRERGRDRSRSRERGRDRSKSREKGRGRSKSRERRQNRSTSRERRKSSRKDRDRSRDRGVSKRERLSDHRTHDRKKSHRHEEKDEEERRRLSGKRNDTPTREVEVEEAKHPVPMEVKLSSSGDVASLSIEQTNKLRISLGLKPLQVEGAPDDGSEEPNTEATSKKEPILVTVKNIGEEKETEKLKQKMTTMRETRRLMKALNSVRTLGKGRQGVGDVDMVEDEDTSSWVESMRKKDEEKRMADKKEKMLAEMDEEFGVGDLLSELMTEDKAKVYGSHDLRGVRVEHDVSAFKDGMDLTLVIKDTDVLDESDPVLMNMNLVEAETAAKRMEAKKRVSSYNPYQDEEVDELGNLKKTEILNKYDEEIHGEKKKAFIIGEGGVMDTSEEKEKEIIRQRLLEKSVTLNTGPSHLASEYFTSEEMVSFKKPMRRKKVRRKEKVKADDLLPLGDDDISKDHGSRTRDKGEDAMAEDVPVIDDYDLRDELDPSMTSALMRTRQLLHRSKALATGTTGAAKVAAMLQRVKREEGEGVGSSAGAIILDKTTEFCKQVGENREDPKEHARRKSSTDHHDGIEEDEMEIDEDEVKEDDEGGWKEVREHSRKKSKPKLDDLYQEAEPLVASGVVATLQLASKKGFVGTAPASSSSTKDVTEVTTSSGRRDIEYERQKEKERDRELSRYGRDSSFPEKKDYIPNVAIEYVDDSGRVLSTKEAFRFMSHKFHGRTSGRKKMDKRLKKIQEEKLLSSASSTDTPLNTLAVLKSKQRTAQSPYILISGGAQSLLAPDIAKRK